VMLVGAWLAGGEPAVQLTLLCVALLILVCAMSFQRLTIRDEGDYLAIRYGPLPLFRKRIPYARITAVERDRSSVLDGWGVHYMPIRGWTYNLWGFDCVKLCLGNKVIRIGSDDVGNLASFLRARTNRFGNNSAKNPGKSELG